ncbi:hypothetical protein M9458_037889, partial [Cirrhinus mrigala]
VPATDRWCSLDQDKPSGVYVSEQQRELGSPDYKGRINTVSGPWALPLESPFIDENYCIHSFNLDSHKVQVVSL